VLGAVVTAVGLLVLDWSKLWWLAIVAVLSYSLALLGYLAPGRRSRGWVGPTRTARPGSYIALVTALLVVSLTVDGPVHGPAAVVVWVLPALVGTRLIQRWERRLEIRRRSEPGRRGMGRGPSR
jgi:hypothetical protein